MTAAIYALRTTERGPDMDDFDTRFDDAIQDACTWVIGAARLARRCGRRLNIDTAARAFEVAVDDAEGAA